MSLTNFSYRLNVLMKSRAQLFEINDIVSERFVKISDMNITNILIFLKITVYLLILLFLKITVYLLM